MSTQTFRGPTPGRARSYALCGEGCKGAMLPHLPPDSTPPPCPAKSEHKENIAHVPAPHPVALVSPPRRRAPCPPGRIAALAVVEERGNMQCLSSLTAEAEAAGLSPGQPLRDALAVCPGLVTRPRNAQAEAAFLLALRRWAGRFSPLGRRTSRPPRWSLDITGCAHLFGGEAALIARAEEDCAAMGLTVQAGIGDSVGAAWALARYAGQPAGPSRSGDAIDQEAPATRARAVKRRNWERGGPAPRRWQRPAPPARPHRRARPGAAGAGALARRRAAHRPRDRRRARPAGPAPCRRSRRHAARRAGPPLRRRTDPPARPGAGAGARAGLAGRARRITSRCG